MDDPWYRRPNPLIAIAVVVAILVLGGLVFGGGQTSTILSTVGAAIPDQPNNVGSGVDTTGDDQGSGTGDSNDGSVADAAAGPPTLLIVRTGTLELEVGSLGSTVTAAGNVVTTAGGYVSGSDESAAGDDASASVVYRIPAASWDATLSAIRGLAAKVLHQQVETEEVTGHVIDLSARITNLRVTEAALQAIMARATKISDVLDVQKELTATRGEIERLIAEKTQLEGRAAYGSLKVTFNLPAPAAVTTAAKGWDPATDIDRATGKLIAIGQWATSAAIFFGIVGLPLLIAGALVIVVAWQVVRLTRWLIVRRTPDQALPG